jgi:hypothetical protein
MAGIAENLLIMVLTVVLLIGGCYVLLVVLDIWLKFKSGSREQDGLSDMLVSASIDASRQPEPDDSGEDPEQDTEQGDRSFTIIK